jgi:hypothetical protein
MTSTVAAPAFYIDNRILHGEMQCHAQSIQNVPIHELIASLSKHRTCPMIGRLIQILELCAWNRMEIYDVADLLTVGEMKAILSHMRQIEGLRSFADMFARLAI